MLCRTRHCSALGDVLDDQLGEVEGDRNGSAIRLGDRLVDARIVRRIMATPNGDLSLHVVNVPNLQAQNLATSNPSLTEQLDQQEVPELQFGAERIPLGARSDDIVQRLVVALGELFIVEVVSNRRSASTMPEDILTHLSDPQHALGTEMRQEVLGHPFNEVGDVGQPLGVGVPRYGRNGVGIASPHLSERNHLLISLRLGAEALPSEVAERLALDGGEVLASAQPACQINLVDLTEATEHVDCIERCLLRCNREASVAKRGDSEQRTVVVFHPVPPDQVGAPLPVGEQRLGKLEGGDWLIDISSCSQIPANFAS